MGGRPVGLEFCKHGDTLVVRVYGELDLRAAEGCRQEIDQKFRAEGAKNLVFNLEGVTFLDSSGLSVILGRYRRVTSGGGRVALTGVTPRLKRLLELAGVARLIPTYPDEAAALRGLG